MKDMKTQFRLNPLTGFATDLLGSAIALTLVWGAFKMLFPEATRLEATEAVSVERKVSAELYDSVMTEDQDWVMLASR